VMWRVTLVVCDRDRLFQTQRLWHQR
jgi:hypothetical protein